MKHFFSFQWHITENCDQRCRHCYIFAPNRAKKPISMSWPDMLKTLRNCLNMCETFDREPHFYLTGGDPILSPHFWRLLGELKNLGINFSILGNPFHLNVQVCARLKDSGCEKYQLSLDGMAKTHDFIRKPGSFDTTLSAIPLLKNAEICAVIMTTVSPINMAEVPAIIDTVVESGADVYSFARYCPESGKLDIEPKAYRQFLDVCQEKFDQHDGKGTWFNKKDHLWTLHEYETGKFQIPKEAQAGKIYDGCNCGNSHISILPDGAVLACRRVKNSHVGNCLYDSLRDIWLTDMEKFRDFQKFSKCAACELLAWCRGCPAVASAIKGDFYDADPQCWK